MRRCLFLALAIMVAVTFSACKKQERITRQSFAFDTVITLTADRADAVHADTALSMCQNYENIFSRTKETSELAAINKRETATLSRDMQAVIDFSFRFSEMTGGAFDVTVAPLSELWNVNKRTVPPTDEEIDAALTHVGYEKVTLSPFNLGEASIDLGAVAKGYIADELVRHFRENDVENVIIDLGGNVALIGEYTVGIRNPFEPESVFARITVKDKSAVTSGAYQRYFEYDGKRYHHIIDPRTGRCADTGIASVTVISPSSMHADALSTAIYVSGVDALSLCSEFSDTDALIITYDGKVITTDGFGEKYNLVLS